MLRHRGHHTPKLSEMYIKMNSKRTLSKDVKFQKTIGFQFFAIFDKIVKITNMELENSYLEPIWNPSWIMLEVLGGSWRPFWASSCQLEPAWRDPEVSWDQYGPQETPKMAPRDSREPPSWRQPTLANLQPREQPTLTNLQPSEPGPADSLDMIYQYSFFIYYCIIVYTIYIYIYIYIYKNIICR